MKSNKQFSSYNNSISKEKLDKLVNIIVENEHPNKIILFGSYATGNIDKNSDIDLLIIKKEVRSKVKEAQRIRRLLKDLRMPKDILVITPEEYNFYKNESGSIFNYIEKEGVIIYD